MTMHARAAQGTFRILSLIQLVIRSSALLFAEIMLSDFWLMVQDRSVETPFNFR